MCENKLTHLTSCIRWCLITIKGYNRMKKKERKSFDKRVAIIHATRKQFAQKLGGWSDVHCRVHLF